MKVALLEPEIHWNAGNVGRTCVATGTPLHLVGPLGFRLDAKQIKRAGLDYWPRLDLSVHADVPAFLEAAADAPLLFFSAHARRSHWEAPFTPDSILVFGKESTGLPADLRKRYARRTFRIPMVPGERSLNLSTAAAVVLYEGLRQTGLLKS